jgi:hypothetical protein
VLIWALVLVPLAAGLLAQRRVRDTFRRYAAVPNMRHVSGAEVHAYQDAEGNRVYRLRKRIAEPLGRAAPWSGPILFGGILLGSEPLIVLSCAYMAGLVAFSAVTLPVELGAWRRALALLRGTHLADDQELPQIRSVLRAAACTYAAGVAQQLGFFGALLLIALAMVR